MMYRVKEVENRVDYSYIDIKCKKCKTRFLISADDLQFVGHDALWDCPDCACANVERANRLWFRRSITDYKYEEVKTE